MNILFFTLLDFNSLSESNIYTDLLSEFHENNHSVYVISPSERRNNTKTKLIVSDGVTILKLRIGNIQKTNILEKGLSTLLVEPLFCKAVRKFFGNVKFDVVLYSTPPITFCNAVKYVKKRDNAYTYLLLKDIFPQNSLDLGMLNTHGIKGLIYKHFKKKEKQLYKLSDCIGCMSQANVEYILRNNPFINPNSIEVNPNSIKVIDKSIKNNVRKQIREKYSLPLDSVIFVYGGNLGKPQCIDYMLSCIDVYKDESSVFFLVVGDGTEYWKIENYVKTMKNNNLRLIKRLPKDAYDNLIASCDVGLIFLDYRFTIPNFPSRLLGYLQARLPVFAVTDEATDIGKVIEKGNFGWWCKSNELELFKAKMTQIMNDDRKSKGDCAFEYLRNHFNSQVSYKLIADRTRGQI